MPEHIGTPYQLAGSPHSETGMTISTQDSSGTWKVAGTMTPLTRGGFMCRSYYGVLTETGTDPKELTERYLRRWLTEFAPTMERIEHP